MAGARDRGAAAGLDMICSPLVQDEQFSYPIWYAVGKWFLPARARRRALSGWRVRMRGGWLREPYANACELAQPFPSQLMAVA
jgi:hypothetical protein